MLSRVRVVRLNLISHQRVIIVVASDEKQRSVVLVMDNDRSKNEFRPFLELWNRLDLVRLVTANERKLSKNVPIAMQQGRFVKRSKKLSMFQRE